jgi:hypothetical protein
MAKCSQYANISVSPGVLSFESTEGWTFVSASQYIRLDKADRGRDPHWTATTEPGAGWLRISPDLGIAPGRIKVYCDARNLTEGLYAGAVVIESDVQVNIPRIAVMLTVHPRTLLPPPGDYHFPEEEPESPPEAPETPPVAPKPKPVPDSPQDPPDPPEIAWWHQVLWAILRVLTFWRPR